MFPFGAKVSITCFSLKPGKKAEKADPMSLTRNALSGNVQFIGHMNFPLL
jgi:hypothetical protein